jgi:hypothetical protein
VGDTDFKMISAAENSNKFQKNQVLEGKISWGHGNTLGPRAQATLVYSMNHHEPFIEMLNSWNSKSPILKNWDTMSTTWDFQVS